MKLFEITIQYTIVFDKDGISRLFIKHCFVIADTGIKALEHVSKVQFQKPDNATIDEIVVNDVKEYIFTDLTTSHSSFIPNN